jgi:elongator complex protein 6
MSGQKQDLIVYNDNSIISDKVLLSPHSYLSVIGHVQGTNPSWLLNSMIENATMGTATQVTSESGMKRKRSDVIFISYLHSADFYYKNCKKNGIDLATMNNFTYIDCFTTLFTELIKDAKNATADIEKMFFLNIGKSRINSWIKQDHLY